MYYYIITTHHTNNLKKLLIEIEVLIYSRCYDVIMLHSNHVTNCLKRPVFSTYVPATPYNRILTVFHHNNISFIVKKLQLVEIFCDIMMLPGSHLAMGPAFSLYAPGTPYKSIGFFVVCICDTLIHFSLLFLMYMYSVSKWAQHACLAGELT